MPQTGEMSRTADLDALVREAQRGDTAAFEAIYRSHAARVYTLCLRLCGDAGRAEELTQDVFVRTWRKIDTFRGESSFETWLYRVAVNQALTTLRSDRRRANWELLTDDPGAVAGPARQVHPGRVLDLEKAIAELPRGARTVFVLHDVEGYRHGEIAKLMGLAEGTCKAQLHRARRLLRGTLTR
jgi:RNA polymerase sigma-70 factor, ECF subfamily